jgi:DNA-binding MarR family transcriptional regulator
MSARESELPDLADLDSGAEARRLQERMIGFVRAFGLLQPDTTPCGQPVSVSEAHALGELVRDAPLGQHELGRRLRLQKSTVSRLVTQMVGRGWVVREPDPGDRRAAVLRLTPKGEAAAARLAEARAAKFGRLLDAIPPSERELVLRALNVLTEALDDDHTTRRPTR